MRVFERVGYGVILACLTVFASLSPVVSTDASARAAKITRPVKISKPVKRFTAPDRDAAIVVDGATGRVLYSRNADEIRYPASLTKMMTLYLLFEALEQGKISMTTPMTASAHAVAQEPTKVGLSVGELIPVETAIKAITVLSANDVAVVIAETLGGTELDFANMMTNKAHKLGMTRTNFHNASGLPDPQQLTTARDLAMLGRHLAYDFPQYFGYFSTPSFTFDGRIYGSHDNLLNAFKGTDGIKTGYTQASGFNLVSSVVRDNKHLVGVLMGGNTAALRDREMMRMLTEEFNIVKQNPTLVADANVPWQGGRGPAINPFANPVASEPVVASLEPQAPQTVVPVPVPQAVAPAPRPAPAPQIVASLAIPVPVPRQAPAQQIVASLAPAPELRGPAGVVIPTRKPAMPDATPAKPSIANALIATAEQEDAVPTPAMGRDGRSSIPAPRLPASPMLKPSLQLASLTVAAPALRNQPQLEEGDISGPSRPVFGTSDSTGKRWSVQIGAYGDRMAAQAQLAAYAEHSMDVLGQARRLVVPVNTGDGRQMYRARFGLFAENEAREICKRMTTRGDTCFAAQQVN